MRPLPFAAALVFATVSQAAAAPRAPVPAAVLVVADVGESAQRTMPAALWRKLVADYFGARNVTAEDGTALPDDARCRNAHALYAVFATFDRAARLPGLGQESDRAYGIARFTVRNCQTGIVSPTKIVRVESEPLPPADRGDFEPDPERTWDRAVRTTLARNPLILTTVTAVATATATPVTTTAPVATNAPVATATVTPVATTAPVATAVPIAAAPLATNAPAATPATNATLGPAATNATIAPAATAAPIAPAPTTPPIAPAPTTAPVAPAATNAPIAPAATSPPVAPVAQAARIVRIDNGLVFLDTRGGFAVDQVLRDFADRDAHPHAPIELVVVEVGRKYVAATVVGSGTPRVGDYVEAAPALK